VPVLAACTAICQPSTELQPTTCFQLQAVAAVAEQQEKGIRDIWDDPSCSSVPARRTVPAATSRAEQSRIAQRAKLYSWQQNTLFRKLPDGSLKSVPRPADRTALIRSIHEQTGHYGAKRTAHLVAASHWWRTLHMDVAKAVSECSICDRVRSSFNTLQPSCKPLPIEPMFYRWGFDLAGSFL
jgi:hypothetical protein